MWNIFSKVIDLGSYSVNDIKSVYLEQKAYKRKAKKL
jgi:hypothetical protein